MWFKYGIAKIVERLRSNFPALNPFGYRACVTSFDDSNFKQSKIYVFSICFRHRQSNGSRSSDGINRIYAAYFI